VPEEQRHPFHIVNMQSGGGATGRRWPRIFEALSTRGLIGDYAVTTHRGHASDLTRRALQQGYDMVVAVGGDGTINEIANAIIDENANSNVCVGTIPTGTGNDVAKSLGFTRPAQAIRGIQERTHRLIDVGQVEAYDSQGRPLTRYFLLEASAGWVPEVSASVPMRLKRLGDTAPYLIMAAVKMTGSMGRDFVVQIDSNFYDGRYNTISVHNMKYWGGDLLVAPGAEPDDGELDVIRWADMGRKAVLNAVQGQRKGGTHLKLRGINHHRACSVSLASGKRTALDLDGESAGYLPAKITVVPRAIKFVVPAPEAPG
jgi:diacylglycerol kinase (ATP)